MSVRHGVGISIIDRDNAAHISLTTPRTDFSFAGTPRWIFSRTSQASKGDRSPSFRWRLRICRGAPPRALRGLIFRTLGDGIAFFSGMGPVNRQRGVEGGGLRLRSVGKLQFTDFSSEGAQIPRKMRFRTPKKRHFASEVGSEGRNLPRGGGFCSPHVPSRSQRHKLREYGTKEARKRLFSNLYLNTFPASTANPLGAARPTHFFWRALRSSTRRGDLQRWWFPLSGAGGRSGESFWRTSRSCARRFREPRRRRVHVVLCSAR